MALFKRRQFIIYPQFQYTLIMTNLFILTTTLIFVGVLLSRSMRYLQTVGKTAELPDNHVYFQTLAVHEASIYTNLFIAAVLSIFVSTILTVVLSHRVAGPIYRLKKHLKNFIETNKYEKLFFRKNDFFSDLPDLVNTTLIKVADKSDKIGTDMKD